MAGAGRRWAQWWEDTARLWGALFLWNGRKSAYILKGRRGHCPCQNASDDPVPGHIRCDAVLHWHQPRRFRRVCPLLVQTSGGWRCSVGPAEVRPFWGRVAGWLALAGLIAWLGAVTVLWGALRVGDQPAIGWSQLAWPGQWTKIRRLQSVHLFARAMGSFGAGRMDEAHLMLSTAREIDPGNYDASLLLAQIAMFQRSFLFADDLFMALWRDHPQRRERTAVTYHDTLVSVGRMDRLAAFALDMASADSARAVVWARSALVGVRLMPAGEVEAFAAAQAANLEKIAPHPRLLLRAELDHRRGRNPEARAALRRLFGGPFNPFYVEYQIVRLAELGAGADAQLALDAQGAVLGEFEQRLAQVKVAQLTGDPVLARATFRALLRLPLNGDRVERIATLLIARPDGPLYRDLHARLIADPVLSGVVDGASLWLAGMLGSAPAEAVHWRSHGSQKIAPAAYPAIPKLDFGNWNLTAPESPLHLLNVLTLPREVVLAVLTRMEPVPGQTAARRSPR